MDLVAQRPSLSNVFVLVLALFPRVHRGTDDGQSKVRSTDHLLVLNIVSPSCPVSDGASGKTHLSSTSTAFR